MKKIFIYLLILSMTIGNLPSTLFAEESQDIDTGERPVWKEFEQGEAVERETVGNLLKTALKKSKELATYADLREKLKFHPKDKQLLETWLKISDALKNDPEAQAEYAASGYTKIPDSILSAVGIANANDLPIYQKSLLDTIWKTVSDPEAEDGGGGREFLNVARLTANYHTDKRQISSEGEEKPEEFEERTISSHFLENIQAADASKLDFLRCTELTVNDKKEITKKEEQNPIPIEFVWQADAQPRNPLGSLGNGQLDPNALGKIFGVSLDDLLRMIGQGQTIKELLNMLSGGGFSLDKDDILNQANGGLGDATGKEDIIDLLSQAIFRDAMLGTIDGNQLQFGSDLAETLDRTGAAILAEAFPNIPLDALRGDNLEELAENYARATLGQRLVAPGFSLEGNTAREIFINLAAEYLTGKVLKIAPTTEIRNYDLGSSQAVSQAIGQLTVNQKLGDKAISEQFENIFIQYPDLVDIRLNLVSGTTSRLVKNEININQFFELVGNKVIEDSIGVYADNPTVRTRVYGLSIDFGPEDIFLPTYKTTREEQIAEIERFYRSQINDADWAYLVDHYFSPSYTDLDSDEEVKNYLVTHLSNQPALINAFLDGTLTEDDWVELGERIFAKIDSRPFNQLALLNYFQTGELWRIPIPDGDRETPVFDPEQTVAEKLGLLPGDLERIISDRFATEILPRVSADLMSNLGGAATEGLASIAGIARRPNPTDEFITGTITIIKVQLDELSIPSGAKAAYDEFKNTLDNLVPSDWQDTATEKRADRLNRILTDLGLKFRNLINGLDADDNSIHELIKTFAGLVAGRYLPDIITLAAPNISVNRSLGLTNQFIQNIFAGNITPNEAIRTLGANYLAYYPLEANDPAAMASDLKSLALEPTADNQTDFYERYQSQLDDAARLYTAALDLQSEEGLSGQEYLGLFTGNRLPLIRNFGFIAYESATEKPGSIYSGSQNNPDFIQNAALQQLLGVGGWLGSLDLKGDLANDLPKLIVEESLGLTWADNATDLIKNNGDSLLRALHAPQELVNQFNQIWDINNPQAALNLLSSNDFWNQIPLDERFGAVFGEIGPQFGNLFSGIFTNGNNPTLALDQISLNLNQFFPAAEAALNLPTGLDPLWQAFKDKDNQAILGNLLTVGSSYLDSRLSSFASILSSGNLSSKETVQWAINSLPQFFGGSDLGPIAGLTQTLTGYFMSGNTDANQLLGAATQFAGTLGIPYVADAMRIFGDPRGFGLSLVSQQITTSLNGAFGGSFISYDTVRNALFGPDPSQFQAQAAAIRANIENSPELFSVFKDLSPESQQRMIEDMLKPEMERVRAAAQKDLQYSVMDAVTGMPPGFTRSMFEGNDDQRLSALLAGASQYTDIPPEAIAAFDLIRHGGDISQISDATFGLMDNRLGEIVGLPLPAGFSKSVANYFAGPENLRGNLQVLSDQLGNFAIGQVSGMLDQELGIPVGTSYAIYQSIEALEQATLAVSQARDVFLTDIGNDALYSNLVEANARLAQVQGAIAGMAVNMVFGGQLANMDSALNLPSGTSSLLTSSLMTSIFTGGSFMAVLGAALPLFAGMTLLSQFMGGMGGLFGGGNSGQKVVMCSAGGFYPYIEKEEDDKYYDPNSNLDKFEPDKRMKAEEVAESLGLWPDYPGEFMGKESDPKAWEAGKRAAARWKIREITGYLLLVRQYVANLRYLPNQLILYEISENSRGKDGDYLKYYDGRETEDERFAKENEDGETVGIIDWPFYPDAVGYGDGTPGSMRQTQLEHYGSYNVGMWVEKAEEYRHHIHIGA